MSFQFLNATKDEHGNVILDCIVPNETYGPDKSFQCYVSSGTVFGQAQEAAETWVKDNPDKVTEYTKPSLEQLKLSSRSNVVAALSALVNGATSQYVSTDPLIWPLKEAEALLFQSRGGSGHAVSDYPSIAGPFKELNPDVTDDQLLIQIAEEVPKVMYKAVAFRKIQDFTEAIRMEAYPLIDNATNEQELLQIVADVQTKIGEFISGY